MSKEVHARIQAAYMEAVRAKAEATLIDGELAALPFDPQGRVLIDVQLTEEELATVVEQFPDQCSDSRTLKEAIGYAPATSDTTTVSIDIGSIHNPDLRARLGSAFQQQMAVGNEAAMAAYMQQARGSVIPLQQEMHFHLLGAKRVLTEKAFPEKFSGKEPEVAEAVTQANHDVNQLVKVAFQTALASAYNLATNTVDIAKLNKALDRARKEIAPEAHRLLRRALVQHTGVMLSAEDLKKVDLKHLAEETTATANDVLHLDSQLHTAMLIRGTDQTAHNRQRTTVDVEGPSFAHRQILTHVLSDAGVEASSNPHIQIRTPSPVVKKGITDAAASADVHQKLVEIKERYQLAQEGQLTAREGVPKAFIYNRYTAVNDVLDDLQGKNKQTQSAKHILKGMHQYNAQQLAQGDNAVFCFVQNISVNGFGSSLGYPWVSLQRSLLRETTLMAEMAMLHTLYEQLKPTEQAQFRELIKSYNAFLETDPRPEYFSQSAQGARAIRTIQTIKDAIKADPVITDADISTPKVDVAKMALTNLVAHNKHFSHNYAKTIQALSVFTEQASIGGCKSGNERAEAINKRVAILDAALNKDNHQPELTTLRDALLACAQNPVSDTQFVALNTALDRATNALGLQTGPTVISNTDQMAAAKVQAKGGAVTINRNHAESAEMINLHQTKASKMQAHKGFATYLAAAWQPPNQPKPSIFQRIQFFFMPHKRREWEAQRQQAINAFEREMKKDRAQYIQQHPEQYNREMTQAIKERPNGDVLVAPKTQSGTYSKLLSQEGGWAIAGRTEAQTEVAAPSSLSPASNTQQKAPATIESPSTLASEDAYPEELETSPPRLVR